MSAKITAPQHSAAVLGPGEPKHCNSIPAGPAGLAALRDRSVWSPGQTTVTRHCGDHILPALSAETDRLQFALRLRPGPPKEMTPFDGRPAGRGPGGLACRAKGYWLVSRTFCPAYCPVRWHLLEDQASTTVKYWTGPKLNGHPGIDGCHLDADLVPRVAITTICARPSRNVQSNAVSGHNSICFKLLLRTPDFFSSSPTSLLRDALRRDAPIRQRSETVILIRLTYVARTERKDTETRFASPATGRRPRGAESKYTPHRPRDEGVAHGSRRSSEI